MPWSSFLKVFVIFFLILVFWNSMTLCLSVSVSVSFTLIFLSTWKIFYLHDQIKRSSLQSCSLSGVFFYLAAESQKADGERSSESLNSRIRFLLNLSFQPYSSLFPWVKGFLGSVSLESKPPSSCRGENSYLIKRSCYNDQGRESYLF